MRPVDKSVSKNIYLGTRGFSVSAINRYAMVFELIAKRARFKLVSVMTLRYHFCLRLTVEPKKLSSGTETCCGYRW
jgi:hypothetical protein